MSISYPHQLEIWTDVINVLAGSSINTQDLMEMYTQLRYWTLNEGKDVCSLSGPVDDGANVYNWIQAGRQYPSGCTDAACIGDRCTELRTLHVMLKKKNYVLAKHYMQLGNVAML